MPWNLTRAPTRVAARRRRRAQAASAAGLGGSSTLPPAFSTAAIADAEAPATFDFDRGLDLALAKQADAVATRSEQAGRHQRRGVDRLAGVELAVVDRLLQRAEIDHGAGLLVRRS